MNRALPPFIVQLVGAIGFLVGLYLAARGRPGAGQIMLVSAGLISTPTAVRALKDRYATLPPPDDDELQRYRKERAEKREHERERRDRAFDWDEPE